MRIKWIETIIMITFRRCNRNKSCSNSRKWTRFTSPRRLWNIYISYRMMILKNYPWTCSSWRLSYCKKYLIVWLSLVGVSASSSTHSIDRLSYLWYPVHHCRWSWVVGNKWTNWSRRVTNIVPHRVSFACPMRDVHWWMVFMNLQVRSLPMGMPSRVRTYCMFVQYRWMRSKAPGRN